jgi:hypothetical protein
MSEVCAACPHCNQELKVSSNIAGILTNVGALFLLIMQKSTLLQQCSACRAGFLLKAIFKNKGMDPKLQSIC